MMKQNTKRLLFISVVISLLALTALFGACVDGQTSVDESEYTITFATEGGTAIDPITVKSGEMAERPENPTKAGHIFKGWFTDLGNTETPFVFDETPITADITLHALWQIRVFSVAYLDENGDPVPGIEGGTVNWGSYLEKPDESTIAKEGYLVKWYTAAGDIWDFETSKITANTTLTYHYVTTKDTYNAEDIALNFYSSYDRGNVSPESSAEHYTEGASSVYYTYEGTKLQEVVLNVELDMLDYSSVTIKARSVGFTVTDDGVTFDPASGGTFSQLRAYILTDIGGHLAYNDSGASGYDPKNYYIQSTGTNKELFSVQTIDGGWSLFTFDLAALKFWQDGTKLYGFAFGFVSTSKAIEIESLVFNEVDKTLQYTVNFTGRLGNTLAPSQTVGWNGHAVKPEKLEDADGCVYTGEWLDATDAVFDFNKGIRSNITLYPQYTVTNKYSWTGEEVGRDFFAAYNEDKTLPANEYAHNGNTVFTFNNGSGSALRQIASDCLDLPIGDYRYLTVKWRTVDYNGYNYNSTGTFALVRIYILTDLGGNVLDKDLDGASNFYINFNAFSSYEFTTPVDMTVKLADGWFVVTVDMTALPYYAEGTTLKGFAIGTTTGSINAIEVSEITLSATLVAGESTTVSFVDADGNAIDGMDDITVPYGKYPTSPDFSLIPEVEGYTFDHWADANGNTFNFGAVLTENVVLHPVYTSLDIWEGADFLFAGQNIVDNFTASSERYGNTVTAQKTLTLDGSGNATFDYSEFNKANMCVTMLGAGIHVHEGSELVITYKSSKFSEYTVTQLKMALAFRGQEPATQIKNTNTNTYYQYRNITYGTMSGSDEAACVSFETAEDGTVTVTFDLYAMQQAYKAKGISEEGVDLNYIEAFTFMVVETNSGTSTPASNATLTFYGFNFKDVQIDKLPKVQTQTYTLSGQGIVDNFTASPERYGNTLTQQNALSLDDGGNAQYDYSGFNKPNMCITMLDAGIHVFEGSKLVITYKSSKFDTYTVTQLKMNIAFRGQDPATQIKSTNTNTYYQYTKIAYGTMSGSSAAACVSFETAEDGTVTVTYDLYAMQQAYKAKGITEEGVDLDYIDAFTFMVVETNSGTSTPASNATLTFYGFNFKDVLIEKEQAE